MAASGHLIFLWHMHQPDYRVAAGDSHTFSEPWVYLHATKDYADMAAHLERHPRMRAVINFSSILLDQLNDYVEQFASGTLRDPLLQLLVAGSSAALTPEQRRYLAMQCLIQKRDTMVRHAGYAALDARCGQARDSDDPVFDSLPDAYFRDLLTWNHLAWCGESLKRTDPVVQRLIAKAAAFSDDDRTELFEVIKRVVCDVLPRYARLADAGSVELSVTPHGHPIAPLLLDFGVARQADPEVPLPAAPAYPGGADRVRWHIDEACRIFRASFARDPVGLWPAEGAVSTELLELVAAGGLRWTATDESVLSRSLVALGHQATVPAAAWRLAQSPGPALFVRNSKVSEFLSFEYSRRGPAEAAEHLLSSAAELVQAEQRTSLPVVCVALDGENAWEFYPHNAYELFDELYGRAVSHPGLRVATPSEFLGRHGQEACLPLARLVPGSWAGGHFGMWIGDERRNAAWDALCTLKRAFDAAAPTLSPAQLALARHALSRCESSDWYWWLGFDEPAEAVLRFDRLFQHCLRATYAALGAEPQGIARAYSRLGHGLHGDVPVHDLALAMAKAIGMVLTVSVPEGELSWNSNEPSPVIHDFLRAQGASGWSFVVPAIELPGAHRPAVFKYAEIKIALEKSQLRFFEGRAALTNGEVQPGLLVIGADRAAAQGLADRFRLPAVLHAGVDERPVILSCRVG